MNKKTKKALTILNNNNAPERNNFVAETKSNYSFSIIALTLLQLTIFYTNRSQIMFLTTRQYSLLYITCFSCLYPLGYIFGSIINQYIIIKLGRREAYIFLFAFVSVSLLLNNISSNNLSWLLLKFFFSFGIAGISVIFDDNLESALNQVNVKTLPKKVWQTSAIRFGNLSSAFLLSAWKLDYYQVVTVSAIILQFSQIFFTLNNNVEKNSPLQKNKYSIAILKNVKKRNNPLFLIFLLTAAIYGIYITLILIATRNIRESSVHRFIVLSFVCGEIVSCYFFTQSGKSKHLNSVQTIHYTIIKYCCMFIIFNVMILLALKLESNFLLLSFIFLCGFAINRIINDCEYLMVLYNHHYSKGEAFFNIIITKQFLSIIATIAMVPLSMYSFRLVILVFMTIYLVLTSMLIYVPSYLKR